MATENHFKSVPAQKSQLIKEINQLKIKVQNFEREKTTHIYNKHGEFYKNFTQLQELEIKSNQDRKVEKGKLIQQLANIKNKVDKFHRELKNVKPTPEFVEKIKVIMEDIEEKITSFKNQQRQLYEDIMKEERITSQEILAIEKKIEMWAQKSYNDSGAVGKKPKITPVSGNTDVTKDLPPEVAAFERFVEQSGGIRAGWDEIDHNAFLRYRVKHNGRPTFIRELIPALVTRTEHEIIEHERWYQQYLELNEEKKEAILKWKERKDLEKQTALAHAGDCDSDSEEEYRKQKEEKYREKIEQEKMERKMLLNKWKVEKELLKAEEEEHRLRQQLEKARKRDQDKLKRESTKLKVQEFKQQREEEKILREQAEAMREEMEAEMRREIASHNIVKFQSRDKQTVEKKLMKEKSREAIEREKEERLRKLKSRVEVRVDRDPVRLLRPTEGWKERQKDPSTSGGQILHMPHRAVPTWRQGMT